MVTHQRVVVIHQRVVVIHQRVVVTHQRVVRIIVFIQGVHSAYCNIMHTKNSYNTLIHMNKKQAKTAGKRCDHPPEVVYKLLVGVTYIMVVWLTLWYRQNGAGVQHVSRDGFQ